MKFSSIGNLALFSQSQGSYCGAEMRQQGPPGSYLIYSRRPLCLRLGLGASPHQLSWERAHPGRLLRWAPLTPLSAGCLSHSRKELTVWWRILPLSPQAASLYLATLHHYLAAGLPSNYLN